jgi:hypothetical protein
LCEQIDLFLLRQFKTFETAQALDDYVLDPLYASDAAHGQLIGAYVLDRAGAYSSQASPRDWAYTVRGKR